MFEMKGRHGSAVVYASRTDAATVSQVQALLDSPLAENSRIRIMPDAHAGIGCVIGTTMEIHDRVCPNLVGVDIGCGMEVVLLEERDVDPARLDEVIRTCIPAGRDKRPMYDYRADRFPAHKFRCPHVNRDMLGHYIGTLGGGNHFIEVDRDESGRLYLVVHSGSRLVGRKIADYYQDMAHAQSHNMDRAGIKDWTERMKATGYAKNIRSDLKIMYDALTGLPRDPLASVTGYLMDDYLHDMELTQRFASANRQTIARDIMENAGLHQAMRFETVHNYIDVDRRILRKGAVSAKTHERFILPLNMRDGALICRGKGNHDWNCSAPHGAGRLYSRSEAKARFTLDEFREAMEGVYTTSVSESTLDESPMAYKNSNEIAALIQPTADIEHRLVPVYNFKAGRNRQ